MWRDYYKYWFLHHKSKAFSEYGIYDREYYAWEPDLLTFQKWKDGRTGMPLIDALMRELNTTGFMPNRGRMIVASYLTHDLSVDWRLGANYFEKMLIDHDPASNYGGWVFSAGLGPGRILIFNTITQ